MVEMKADRKVRLMAGWMVVLTVGAMAVSTAVM